MQATFTDVLSCGCSLVLGGLTSACPAAETALAQLMRGNAEYLTQEHNPAPLTALLRTRTADEGQTPVAAVVCCSDSRVPPEHIFAAGIGELFVIRNAGNVVTPDALASVEYAVGHLHVPLVLVLGHRGCGAVAAALSGEKEPGALGELVFCVAKAVEGAKTAQEAETQNLRAGLSALGRSSLLRTMAARGKTAFAGGIYDIRTGKVALLNSAE